MAPRCSCPPPAHGRRSTALPRLPAIGPSSNSHLQCQSMSLVDWSVIIMGTWVIVVVAAGLVLALRPGGGELEYDMPVTEPLRLRQTSGVMPRRAWGFR